MAKKTIGDVWDFATNRPVRDRFMGPYTKAPWKYYVYIWLDVNGLYYVGKGHRSRGWEVHCGTGNTPTKAQQRREQFNRSFRCMVVHDGMTSKAALNLEAMLIHRLKPVCNQKGKRNASAAAALKAYQVGRRGQVQRSSVEWEEKGRKALEVQANWKKRLGKSLADHVKDREAAESEREKRIKALASHPAMW